MEKKIVILFLFTLIFLSINVYSENSERMLNQSKVHNVGNLNLRVSNFGTFGSNGEEWPSLEYPANSGIDRLRISSLWFGAKKVRRNELGSRLFWLHWPPLDEDDIVAENEPNWTPDLQLVVDTLTSVGFDGDLDLYEFLPAYNPLEIAALGSQYQMYNHTDVVIETSISEQMKGIDDDGDGLIDEDPIGYSFPLRNSSELPQPFSIIGGQFLHELYDYQNIIIENQNIWFPFEYIDLTDNSNQYCNFTDMFDNDCDGLIGEDGYPLSEQDFIAYYYDYSPFGTTGQRDYGGSSSQSNHYPLNIAVRHISHQWSYAYLSDIIYLEFSITNMNPVDILYDCAAGLFVDSEIGPQAWSEEDRKNDDVSSYVAGENYEFAYSYDEDFDAGLSTGYIGTKLCSPDPNELEFGCWTWNIGAGPDDSEPLDLSPVNNTSNEKYWLLTDRNPDDSRFISLRDFPNSQFGNPCNTRYLYNFYGDMQGMTNPTDYSWNIEPLKTMKIVIALFVGDEYESFINQALWSKTIYGISQSLSGSCLPDTFSHFIGPKPPTAPQLFAKISENETDIELYWNNKSEIDNIDTEVVNNAFIGWQDVDPNLDSYYINYDPDSYPEVFAPDVFNGGSFNDNALVNPWTGYRLRHDFQGYSIWGKPESNSNNQWELYDKYDKIETEQDMADYMVNNGNENFIDFGGDLGLDTGLPNQHISVSLDQQYYHFSEMYELVPYQIGDPIFGYPLYNADIAYNQALQDIAYSLSFEDQSLLFKHPNISDDLYLSLYDDSLIPLENHIGNIFVNNDIENPEHIKDRLSRRYYHYTIPNYPSDEDYCVSVTAWDRGMPSLNMQSLDSGKWENIIIINNFPNNYLIWPGDTNFDGIVNENDIDAIAIYFRKEGDARSSVSFEWNGNDVPGNWEEPEASLADCNGDGEVNITDVLALCLNWGKTHETFGNILTFSDEELLNKKSNFLEIYNSLGNSNIEVRIKNHIAEKFDLPIIEIAINKLHNNYPNPFNPTTDIRYSIAKKGNVELSIYNIKGQLVKRFKKNDQDSGSYSIVWNGCNMSNKKVSSGMYFYKLVNNGKTIDTKKMLLIK